MTDSLDPAVSALVDALDEITDPVERYQAVKSIETRLDVALKKIKADIATTLYDGRSWDQVGKLIGVTGSRAEQISRGAR